MPRALLALALLLALAACDTQGAALRPDAGSPEGDTAGGPDGNADGEAVPDAAIDTADQDAAPETAGADARPDGAREDAAPDAVADVPPDIGADTGADAAGPDAAGPDAAPDVAADAGPDVTPWVSVCEGELTLIAHETTADPTFRRGPYVQSLTTESAVIVWRGEVGEVADGCVTFAVGEGEPELVCRGPDAAGQYEVPLEGLPAGAAVTYTATVRESSAGPFTFRTAPAGPEPTRLLVYADAHHNTETLPVIAAAALEAGVALAVGVGDHISQPEEPQWDEYFSGLRALGHRVPIFPAIGNHEEKDETYYHAFVVPGAAPPPREPESWYSVRHGAVWLGILELDDLAVAAISEPFGIETPESAWLKAELAGEAAGTARWRLLFVHEPPYAQGWGSCDHYQGEATLRSFLVPLAAENGVAAIFSGHVHGWEQGFDQGVALVTTGGAGGGLDIECPPPDFLPDPWTTAYVHHYTVVTAACDRLTIEAFTLDGAPLDRVEIPFGE